MGGAIVAGTTLGFQFGGASAISTDAHECDRALVEGLRSGDERAYEELISRFEHPVFNLVSRLTDDPEDAPDVVQEVFLKVFRNVNSFRGDSSVKTWIYRIAVNEARNHRRWLGRHKRNEIGLDSDSGDAHSIDHLTDPGRSPLDLAIDHETQAVIEAALSEVNPHFRAALVLREIEGLSYDEIGQILEISLGTVKSRILRGREALRHCLADRLKQNASAQLAWRARELMAR